MRSFRVIFACGGTSNYEISLQERLFKTACLTATDLLNWMPNWDSVLVISLDSDEKKEIIKTPDNGQDETN